MTTQENVQIKKPDNENFLTIFNNLKRCKGMDWEEKVILSNYISFQRHGKEFYQTDASQARELGLSPAQISKYTSRLKERGEIHTKIEYEENSNGGRPIPVRYVKVIDIDKWMKGETVPTVKKIVPPSKKKLDGKLANLTNSKTETVIIPIISGSTVEAPSVPIKVKEIEIIQPKKAIKKEPTLEENLAEAEAKKRASTSTKQIKTNSNKVNGILTIDAFKDVDNSMNTAKAIIAMIKNGEELDYITVNVRFSDTELSTDEALWMTTGKYVLKSFISQMQKTICDDEVEL